MTPVRRTARGTLAIIDNTVDPTTGTIRLKATFDNGERLLWPGQFVNVVLHARHARTPPSFRPKRCRPGSRGSSSTW